MAIGLSAVSHAKQVLRRSLSFGREGMSSKPPKGQLAVYVGEQEKRRYMVPVSYLNQPLFQDLLSRAEEEFGYDHPMGGLTIPCSEDTFVDLISQMSEL
ncbi:auxin-responsive protein SAUR24-like [Punica granatum]|uniref:Auxin-responsive protein SAUR24-like n=2 Tax=Punica granatum TaxID=22663 RepID=A0A6P8C8D3_PUNGR|nr:auxin-responsive protein SAUR24-like [Punica granatum]